MKTNFADRWADYISEVGDSTLVALYNEYADSNCYEHIYGMEDFNEIMQGFEPMDIARQVAWGNFKPYADWFTFDGYGNIESILNPDEYIDLDSLRDWCEEHESIVTDVDSDAEVLYEVEEEEETEQIPAWALSAIVNDDYSGLEDEDIKLIEDWFEETGYTHVCCPSDDDEPYFSPCPAFGLACDVYDCVCY